MPSPSKPPNHHPEKGSLTQRSVNTCLIALVAIIVGAPRASAASTLDVQITFTIPAVISVQWGGGYAGTAPAVWAVGTVALNTEYNTLTPTHGTGGSWTDNLRITNSSTATNTAVDIDLVLALPAAGWTAAAAPGANEFEVRAKESDGSATLAELQGGSVITTAATVDFINALAVSATTNEIDFLFHTPVTITSNAGVAQTITLTFTASVDN